MNEQFRSVLAKANQLSLANKRKLALNTLATVPLSDVSQEQLLPFAEALRIAGNPNQSLRLLKRTQDTRPEVLLEKARCLLTIGARRQSLSLLHQLKEAHPLAFFIQGCAHAQSWENRSAISHLESFLKVEGFDFEKKAAISLLLVSYRLCGEFENASRIISEFTIEPDEATLTSIVASAFKGNASLSLVEALKEQRLHARISNRYDREREIDFYIATLTQDVEIFNKLYFGTSSDEFRARILQVWRRPEQIFEEYQLSTEKSNPESVFDLRTGTEKEGPANSLKVGQKIHRLLVFLCSDFYQPVSVAELAEHILPHEDYDPDLTPARIHQLVKRIKAWAKEGGRPIRIEENSSRYKLLVDGNYAVRISRRLLEEAHADPLWVRLTVNIPQSTFNISDAASALGVSKRFARKVLQKAQEKGWIAMEGNGRKTRYVQSKPNSSAGNSLRQQAGTSARIILIAFVVFSIKSSVLSII